MKAYEICVLLVVKSNQWNIFLYHSVVQLMTGKKFAFGKKNKEL